MTSSYIAMNYKCNHNCICCPLSTFDRLHSKLDYEILKKQIVDIIAENGGNGHFTISGGEPTIDNNFIDLISYLAKLGLDVSVLSNASSCEDKDFVKRIIDAFGENYDKSKFSYVTAIHSNEEKIHDYMTGVTGSYLQTMRGLDNLADADINITIKHIMNKYTCSTMVNTFDYLNYHFLENVEFLFCSMDYTGRCSKNIDKLFIDYQELKQHLEDTLDNLEQSKINRKIFVTESPLCMTDPYYWKYYLMHEEFLSTYIAPNLETRYNKGENVVNDCNTNYSSCQDCDVKNYCGGIWSSAYELGKNHKNFLRPVKVLRK